MSKPDTKILDVRPADKNHQVVTLTADTGSGATPHCRTPCATCPWRKDAVGEFPAEAFVHSARTSYDMSNHTFACHSTGTDRSTTCAGFLLSASADNNMCVRMNRILRRGLENIEVGNLELFDTYIEMAVANGVDPDHPALKPSLPKPDMTAIPKQD